MNDDVHSPQQPVIGRPIILAFVGTPKESVLKLIKFIREEGSRYGVPQ